MGPKIPTTSAWSSFSKAEVNFAIFSRIASTTLAMIRAVSIPVARAESEMRRWFDAEMARFVRPTGRTRGEEHLEKGHIVALMSSGTRYTLEPLADMLGIKYVVCTVFEEAEGLLTGRHIAPACAGEGKVSLAERFALEHDVDLDASYFYTDSHADIGLLERVGLPRVVTPDLRLRRQARRRGWSIEDWAIA